MAQEGPPLPSLGAVPMEVADGTTPAQDDGIVAEEEISTMAEQAA